jgi:hypothetical protein
MLTEGGDMADVYRVRTAITGSVGGPMLNTLWFDAAGGTEQQAATAAQLFWHNARLRISNAFSMLVEPLVYTVDIATGLANGSRTVTTSVETGGVSSDNMPGYVQGIVVWHTGVFVGGREVIGRTFLPGVTEGDNSNSAPSGSYLTDMGSAATALETTVAPPFVIYSPTHHVAVPVASHAVDSQWAILKSRRA